VTCAATEGQNLPCSPFAAAARRRAEYQRHPGISNIKAPSIVLIVETPPCCHARAERSSALPEGGSCGLVNRQHPCLSNVGVHFAVNQEPQTGRFEFAFLGALGFQAICSGWLLGTKPSHKIPTCMGIILSRLVMRDFLLSFRRSCHHRVPSSFESCGEDELCAFILMRRLSS
jgi:hypothetical protein